MNTFKIPTTNVHAALLGCGVEDNNLYGVLIRRGASTAEVHTSDEILRGRKRGDTTVFGETLDELVFKLKNLVK